MKVPTLFHLFLVVLRMLCPIFLNELSSLFRSLVLEIWLPCGSSNKNILV